MHEACFVVADLFDPGGDLPVSCSQPLPIKILLSAGADRSTTGTAAAARRPRRASAAAAGQQPAGRRRRARYRQAGLGAASEQSCLPGTHGLDPLLDLEDSAAELEVPLAVLAQQSRARGAAEDSMPLAQLAALQQRQAAKRSGCLAKREQLASADRPDSAEVQPGLQRAAQQRQAGHGPQQGDLQEPALASQQSSDGVGPASALLLGGALTGIEVPGSSKSHAAAALPPLIPPSWQTRLRDRVLSAPQAVAAQLPEPAQLPAGSVPGAPQGPVPLQQKQQGLGSLQAQHGQGRQPPMASAADPLPFSAWAPASQETLNHPDNMGDIYVECDLCKKWRHLPKGHQVGS